MDREEDEAGRPLRAPELARRFDTVEPRHGDVEHDDIRMEPLRLSKEFASIAHSTDHQTLAGQRVGRQREHRRMIISQQHARVFRGARLEEEAITVPLHSRCWKPPILSKLTGITCKLTCAFFNYRGNRN